MRRLNTALGLGVCCAAWASVIAAHAKPPPVRPATTGGPEARAPRTEALTPGTGARAPRTPPSRGVRAGLAVSVPCTNGLPPELTPLKAGSTEKATGALAAWLTLGPLPPISALAFSPDGTRLIVAHRTRVSVWSAVEGKLLYRLEGTAGLIHALAFSPDGTRLAVAGGRPTEDGVVWLFDGRDPRRPLGSLKGHTDVVFSAAWSPDGSRLATGSFDRTVRLWDAGSLKALAVIRDHSDLVTSVAFAPNGKFIASTGKDRSIKTFDAADGKPIRVYSGQPQEARAVAISPDSNSLLTTGLEPNIRFWNAFDTNNYRTQGAHGQEVHELFFTADRQWFVTVSSDRTVRTWGLTGNALKTFSAPDPLLSAAVSPDGKRVAAGSAEGRLFVWDTDSTRLLLTAMEAPGVVGDEFFASIPAGYFHASPGVEALLGWRVGDVPVTAPAVLATLRNAAEVARSLRGEPPSPIKFPQPEKTP